MAEIEGVHEIVRDKGLRRAVTPLLQALRLVAFEDAQDYCQLP
jgi:hypothetical protein